MERFNNSFYKWEKELANQPFLRQPFGDKWEEYTWKEAGEMARRLATGLKSMGLPDGAHIGLVSKNCREWVIADLAIMMAGHVSVPFYATLTGNQIADVLKAGDVQALFVGKLECWDDMKTGVPEDMPVIAFPHYEGNSKIDRGHQWDDFINKFEPLTEVAEPNLDDTWTIIFTSGTTGTPKGVVLTYSILQAASIPTETGNPLELDLKNNNNRFFSYLPMNHIAERIVVEQTCLRYGGTISFSESLAKFPQNLQDTKPTVFFGVPRIYTKFQQGVLSKMPQKKLDRLLKIPIVSGIVKKKLRTALGLNEAKKYVSGAAALPDALKAWYQKIGIDITNGYAMTENCAICTFLDGKDKNIGSVGKAQPGVELKIDEDSGEILMKGAYVMKCYYNEPEKTAEVLSDGWLHTGDQGRIDSDGYLYITGRVKDTFKTAKGKYIIPGPLELGFSENTDIEQLCLVGLGCPQPMLLVNLSENGAAKTKEDIIESLETSRTKVNEDKPNYQKISKLIVVKESWGVENNLLTPTLKVKRNVVNKYYDTAIQKWMNEQDSILFE